MYLIPQITADPLQQSAQILPDGSTLFLTLYFVPLQKGWFIQSLEWNNFILRNYRITVNPNMLNQWRNLINFGLGCFTQNQQEPTQQQDFSSGFAQLYILSSSEVIQYVELLANG